MDTYTAATYISTRIPFRVDMSKPMMTRVDSADYASHPKHPVPPRSVAAGDRVTTKRSTYLIAMFKNVSTQARKSKSGEDIVDVQLLDISAAKCDKFASVVVSVFGTQESRSSNKVSGNRWRSSAYR